MFLFEDVYRSKKYELKLLTKGLKKKFLSFAILCFLVCVNYGQAFSVGDLFRMISYPLSKFDNYLSRNGFAFRGKNVYHDTLLRIYDYRRTKNFKNIDSISRSITRADIKDNSFIMYETASLAEFMSLKEKLKQAGLYSLQLDTGNNLSSLLYQNKDLSVRTFIKKEDSTSRYSFVFHKKIFPPAKDIYYANDLLTFTSHEYLVYYFGEKNVKKDIYFLSRDVLVKCSVLFLNTKRQVVFLWEDENNLCRIASLLFGGQQNLKSSIESGKYVEENSWALKSGVRPGMSLIELRMLNGNDFRFYGGNSANSGSVIPDNTGKLDFKKEEIILGCLNCRDNKFGSAKVVNADDSIIEGRILFVLSVILNPL